MKGDGAPIPIIDIAHRANVSVRALREQLTQLDKKIGGGLIVRYSSKPRAKLYIDKIKLREHMPGYLTDDVDPVVGVHDKVDALVASAFRIEKSLDRLEDLVESIFSNATCQCGKR